MAVPTWNAKHVDHPRVTRCKKMLEKRRLRLGRSNLHLIFVGALLQSSGPALAPAGRHSHLADAAQNGTVAPIDPKQLISHRLNPNVRYWG